MQVSEKKNKWPQAGYEVVNDLVSFQKIFDRVPEIR